MSSNTAVTRKIYHVDGGPPDSATKCRVGYLHGKQIRLALESLQASHDFAHKNLRKRQRRKYGYA
jgi:hypothetical protein